MSELYFHTLQSYRHHYVHAHFPINLRHPLLSWSYSQWTGYLRGGGVQEENGFGHLRAELGHSRHAVPARDAFQHSPAGQRQAMGFRELYVQSGCGGGCKQPVYHSGHCYCALH